MTMNASAASINVLRVMGDSFLVKMT
jgi:hypothetical protein